MLKIQTDSRSYAKLAKFFLNRMFLVMFLPPSRPDVCVFLRIGGDLANIMEDFEKELLNLQVAS
ncbi:hypothetical protein EEL52_00270 [Muribaculaceae bacterium Isolate-113 (HZI)]|jgi:hypothetical protein|nr:hypothetical protein EEL53_01220 [Muribaculaceae bacterium Isolate-114 (HZI)]ROT25171.1 hypothetical protein EEL52_00270 [Muribaculaceae bacterium Isolate-113 (HZI)]RXE69734.1 hypothetical protein ED328_01990 [Muribaculaceae bacterium Isolate-001 (NCI)]HBY17308.1 hypothetical protein [Porphyromonadaceae bacterium]